MKITSSLTPGTLRKVWTLTPTAGLVTKKILSLTYLVPHAAPCLLGRCLRRVRFLAIIQVGKQGRVRAYMTDVIVGCGEVDIDRIIGGQQVGEGEVPWMCAIMR